MRKSGIYVLLMLLAIVPNIILRGFVLKVLWGWFLSPLLTPTAPSVALCMGITTIFTLLIGSSVAKKVSDKKEAFGTGFNIEKLPIDERSKEQLRALLMLADRNTAYAIKESLMGMITAPLAALMAGWILKHFV